MAEPRPMPIGTEAPGPKSFQQPMVPDHPSKPIKHSDEEIEEFIPIMVEEDLLQFDPDFVIEVVDFASKNGMEDEAERIISKMDSNLLAYFRTVNAVSSADTRANGLDESDDDEDMIFIEEEEDHEPESFIEGTELTLKPISLETSLQQPLQAILLLDL
ncbi:MAG: hypothetical protein E7Z70_02800 [Thermoplasmata archaeon]|nr:hypothetical protein [Thermoplasmata archaeon]